MVVYLRRRAVLFAAALLLLLSGVAVAAPAAAKPVPQPDSGQARVLEGLDFSQLRRGEFSRRRASNDFPTGNVYCTPAWHPRGCLAPLQGSVVVRKECGSAGTNVDIRIYNPNLDQAPRDLYHLDSTTGTGFGDSSFVPPGWSIFPITNIDPGTYDFLVRWDPQNLTFFQRLGVVLTCPSPPHP